MLNNSEDRYINLPTKHCFCLGRFFILVSGRTFIINGQILCPSIGNCQVYGEGFIKVIPNNTYYIGWQNTAFGQCVASLQ